jgi:hypothetical protein
MVVMEEEGMAAVPAGADKVRPDRCMCETCAAEARSANMGTGEMRAAHAADMHAAEAASVHSASEATAMHSATEATAVHPAAAEAAATMAAAAETTTPMAAAPTSATPSENGRSDRHRGGHGRRDDAGEKPVVHLTILLVAATVSPLQGIR